MFSQTVLEHWLGAATDRDVVAARDALRVVVDPSPPHGRRVSILALESGGGLVTVEPRVADALGLESGASVAPDALHPALAAADIALHGADALHHLPADAQAELLASALPAHVRVLSADDASRFAAFEAAAPPDDLDEAFVELDHRLVVGAIVDGRLASAASMYPWGGGAIGDMGVITLPEHRGRGLGRDVVRALCAEALRRGLEPQYRCQLDNVASLALARAAGLRRLGTWDVDADAD